MMTRPSALLLEQIEGTIKSDRGMLRRTEFGTFYEAPSGALARKALFVPSGDSEAERALQCSRFYEAKQELWSTLRIWIATEAPFYALIVDVPTKEMLELLERASQTARWRNVR